MKQMSACDRHKIWTIHIKFLKPMLKSSKPATGSKMDDFFCKWPHSYLIVYLIAPKTRIEDGNMKEQLVPFVKLILNLIFPN